MLEGATLSKTETARVYARELRRRLHIRRVAASSIYIEAEHSVSIRIQVHRLHQVRRCSLVYA